MKLIRQKKRLVVSRRDLLEVKKKQKPRLGVMPKKPGSKLLKKLVLPQKKPLMLLLKKDRQLQDKLVRIDLILACLLKLDRGWSV